MQYTYEGEAKWVDIEPGEAYRFDVTKWVIFREKPAFEPGYYRQTLVNTRSVLSPGFVQWWCVEPDLDQWERVEVTPVD